MKGRQSNQIFYPIYLDYGIIMLSNRQDDSMGNISYVYRVYICQLYSDFIKFD